MENLSFGFTLNDGMSQALKSITNSLASTINYLEDVNKSIGNLDNQNFNSLKNSVSSACSSVDSIRQSFNEATGSANSFEKNISSINSSGLNSVKKSAENAAGSLGDIGNEALSAANDIKRISGNNLSSISAEAENAAHSVDRLGDEAGETKTKLESVNETNGVLGNSFSSLKTTVLGAVAAFASFETAKAAINLSDQMTQTTSRLNLMNDGLQTTGELQESIKQAALNSHAEYQTMADTVAKLGNNAGAAFSSSSEIVSFAEQLSKQFAISGASAEEMSAATLQLTQGLASGVLRGDEFNSVMEQAPGIAQMIADYLQVDKSQIRDLASEGVLTADVVKNAILGATNETNQKFDQMKVTFGQLWTDFKTKAMFAFLPVSEAISNIANNQKFQGAIGQLGTALEKMGQTAAPVIEAIGNSLVTGFSWVAANWQTVVTGLGAIAGTLLTLSAASAVVDTINKVKTSMTALSGVTKGVGEAQGIAGLAGKLLGLINPVTLAVAAVMGLAGATAYFIATGTKISDIIQGFTSFDTAVSSFASNFGGTISGIVEEIQQNLPQIAAQAGTIVSTLITGILNSAANLIGAGAEIILQIIVGLAQSMPTIVSSGITFITNFLSGLMAGIPKLADTVLTIVQNFLSSLAENLPTLIQSGADTLMAWCQGLGQALPQLFAQAVIMISGFIQTIGEHLPEIIQTGFQLLTNLVTGIIHALPTIIGAAISLLGNFIGYLVENFPMILQAGINMIGSLAMGLIQSIPTIVQGLGQILAAIMNGIGEAIPQIGQKAIEIGGQLIEGFKGGVSQAWSDFTNWLSERWNEVVTNIKNFFGIASPSTVFADIGSNLLQGFWNGLKSVWDQVSGWLSDAWNQVTSIFGGGEDSSVPGVDFSQAEAQLDAFNQKVTEVFGAINQQSINLGQTMVANIVAGLGALPAQIGTSFAATQEVVASEVAIIVANAIAGFNVLIPGVSAVFAAVSQQSIGLLSSFSANALGVVQSLIGAIVGTMGGLAQSFIGVFAAIVTGAANQLDVLKSSSLATMKVMVDGIVAQFGGMSDSILAKFSILTNGIKLAIATLTTVFDNGWEGIKTNTLTTISLMNQAILSSIQQLTSNIVTELNKLPGEFSRVASSAMNSFKSGIDSNKQSIVDSASDLVQKLKNTFEQGLGIHSPSDYMIWIGQMMLAGLMEGMSQSQITSFIESTIMDMQKSFEGGSFNAAETMDFLSQEGALNLIAKVTGMDLSAVTNAPASIPGIIQAAQQHINYRSPGGRYNSKFGLRYNNAADWCVSFVRAMAEDSGVPFPATNYVPSVVEWAKSQGRWTQEPQSGYAVIFDYSGGGSGSHIELVETVRGPRDITTIGGNTGNPRGVYRQDRRSSIMGYVALDGGHGVGSTLATTLQTAYNNKYNPSPVAISEGSVNWVPDAGVSQWTNIVQQALQLTGQPLSYTNDILYAIQRESSGNPNDTNNWDSNAAIGQNSRGLMQVIPDTFASYRDPSLSNNIYDPLANIVAAIRYIIARYGSIPAMVNPRRASRDGWYGYAVGTRYVPDDMLAMIHKGEAILPASQNPYTNSGGNYLGDMISANLPDYELNSYLNANDAIAGTTTTNVGGSANITLNVTQNITDSTDARGSAEMIIDLLYDTIEEQYNSKGGGVVLGY